MSIHLQERNEYTENIFAKFLVQIPGPKNIDSASIHVWLLILCEIIDLKCSENAIAAVHPEKLMLRILVKYVHGYVAPHDVCIQDTNHISGNILKKKARQLAPVSPKIWLKLFHQGPD